MNMVEEAVNAALKKAAWVVDRRNRMEPCRVAEEDQLHMVVLAAEVRDLRDKLGAALLCAKRPKAFVSSFRDLLAAILREHSPFRHSYVRQEKACATCRMVARAERLLNKWGSGT